MAELVSVGAMFAVLFGAGDCEQCWAGSTRAGVLAAALAAHGRDKWQHHIKWHIKTI